MNKKSIKIIMLALALITTGYVANKLVNTKPNTVMVKQNVSDLLKEFEQAKELLSKKELKKLDDLKVKIKKDKNNKQYTSDLSNLKTIIITRNQDNIIKKTSNLKLSKNLNDKNRKKINTLINDINLNGSQADLTKIVIANNKLTDLKKTLILFNN